METKDQPRYIGTAEITRAIQAAISYLSNHISPSGKFDYIFDPRTCEVSRGYNLLRHAGTTMALYQMVGSVFDDGAIGFVADLAGSYLQKFLVSSRDTGRQLCFLTNGRIAKLGGTALALLALAASAENSPSDRYAELVQQLGWYLVSQQKVNGRFVSKIDCLMRIELPAKSAYYPGQAVLALCAAYQITKEVTFLESADHGARHIAEQHKVDPPTATGFADHWTMMALAALHKIHAGLWYVNHLRYLAEPLVYAVESGNPSWIDSEYTTHIATRIEGLLACLNVELSLKDEMRAMRLLRTVLTGLTRCYQRQIGGPGWPALPQAALGGFVHSFAQPTIRIDYVQHVLAPSFGLFRILEKRDQQ
jgi:hypothetical protein